MYIIPKPFQKKMSLFLDFQLNATKDNINYGNY